VIEFVDALFHQKNSASAFFKSFPLKLFISCFYLCMMRHAVPIENSTMHHAAEPTRFVLEFSKHLGISERVMPHPIFLCGATVMLRLVPMGGGTAPCRPGSGGSEARGGREGERRREQSRRTSIVPLSPALAGVQGRKADGSEAARWRWARGVGQE
jgi:hypothetical protein